VTGGSAPLGLLDAIVRDALDPSYAEAAERRERARSAETAGAPTRASRRWIGAGLMVVAGAIAGLAVSFQHKVIPQVGAARSALAGDAGTRSDQVKALTRSLAQEQRDVAALQRQQLQATATGRQLDAETSTLSAAAGQMAVQGAGFTVTVSDAGTSSVTDRDLQAVVNAVWTGGAEAVSVAGVRLGPQTAIRTAGQTILADFHALRSPYVIAVIGGERVLDAVQGADALKGLDQGPQGTHPDVTIGGLGRVSLPAASAATITAARPLTTGGHS
jgi:uncharacterized protein YlxW (UPF0749 family)